MAICSCVSWRYFLYYSTGPFCLVVKLAMHHYRVHNKYRDIVQALLLGDELDRCDICRLFAYAYYTISRSSNQRIPLYLCGFLSSYRRHSSPTKLKLFVRGLLPETVKPRNFC